MAGLDQLGIRRGDEGPWRELSISPLEEEQRQRGPLDGQVAHASEHDVVVTSFPNIFEGALDPRHCTSEDRRTKGAGRQTAPSNVGAPAVANRRQNGS